MHNELTFEVSESVALTVREELARRRLSRQWLADEARVSLSTLEKALAGRRPFTLATVVRLEDALGTSLRARNQHQDVTRLFAPESMGNYARPAVQWLEGTYLTLRPSFSEPGAIFAYLTAIGWDEGNGHLVFSESARTDSEYEQKGFVSFPNISGAIYLVTISQGQYRVAERDTADARLRGRGPADPGVGPARAASDGARGEQAHRCRPRGRFRIRRISRLRRPGDSAGLRALSCMNRHG